jgi:hypothetical protein
MGDTAGQYAYDALTLFLAAWKYDLPVEAVSGLEAIRSETQKKIVPIPSTMRQREILDYVQDFQERRRYKPSYRMIARHIGVSSKATVAKHVHALRQQGFDLL